MTPLRWDEWVNFEIHPVDLPRTAKLCLAVCAAPPGGRRGGGGGAGGGSGGGAGPRGKQYATGATAGSSVATGTSQGSEGSVGGLPGAVGGSLGADGGSNGGVAGGTMLNWCNLNLFDYNGYLVNRRCSLSFRPPPREWSDLLYPLGQTTGDWNDLLRCGHDYSGF